LSLEDVPSYFAIYTGINETTAQLLLSLVVIFSILVPTMILSRGKNAVTIWLIAVFLGECIVLGLGWLPFWVMIMTIAVTALGIAFLGGKLSGGD
jgi:cyanate permease